MAVHEAISLGVPVVTNRSDTLERVLEEAGVYCAREADAMAAAFATATRDANVLRGAARLLKPRRIVEVQAELDGVRRDVPELFVQTPFP